MTAISLTGLVQEQLQHARDSSRGRSARTLVGGSGQVLRQTLMAIVGGHALADHESPGDATLMVLHGRVRLVFEGQHQDGAEGDLLVIPRVLHRLEAVQDAVVLLTVASTP